MPTRPAPMDEFHTVYEVEFPAPRTPADWSVSSFEAVLAHLLAEEALLLRDESGLAGVHLGWTEGVGRELPSARRARYHLVQSVRFDERLSPFEKAERLRVYLVEALGLAPRQYEGPWNILSVEVRPAEPAAPAAERRPPSAATRRRRTAASPR